EGHDQPARAQALERPFPGVLAHRVVDHRHFLAAGDRLYALDEVLAAVVHDVLSAVRLGKGALFVRAGSTYDRDAEVLEPLTGDRANAAGGSVPQHGFALLDRIGGVDEVVHRQALQHHRGGLLVRDPLRELHHPVRRHDALLAVRARQSGVGDPVARLQVGDALPDRFDDACAFVARDLRELHRIEPRALVDVDEVDADRGVADARLPLAGIADLDILVLHDFGTTLLVEADCLCHGTLLSEDGQDAGVAVQPVAGDFTVAEESYQWNLTERSFDEVQFRTPAAEHVLAARHARVVQRTARVRRVPFQARKDAFEILSRRRGVALAEENFHAGLDQVADRDQAGLGIDAHDIARGIVSSITARHRQADQELRPFPADRLEEHLERRAAVEPRNEVVLPFRDAEASGVGRAAL